MKGSSVYVASVSLASIGISLGAGCPQEECEVEFANGTEDQFYLLQGFDTTRPSEAGSCISTYRNITFGTAGPPPWSLGPGGEWSTPLAVGEYYFEASANDDGGLQYDLFYPDLVSCEVGRLVSVEFLAEYTPLAFDNCDPP